MNKTELSTMLGVSNLTIDGWVKHGCPGDKTKSRWNFVVKKVFKWRLEYERSLQTDTKKQTPEQKLNLEARTRASNEKADDQKRRNDVAMGLLVNMESVRHTFGEVALSHRSGVEKLKKKLPGNDAIINEFVSGHMKDLERKLGL